MPKLRALALSIGFAATAGLLASPQALAAKKKAPKKPAVAPVCQDFYGQANADWLKANLLVAGTGMESALGQLADRAHQVLRGRLPAPGRFVAAMAQHIAHSGAQLFRALHRRGRVRTEKLGQPLR